MLVKSNVLIITFYSQIAAFIAEPVMGAGGVILPPKTYFEKVSVVRSQFSLLSVRTATCWNNLLSFYLFIIVYQNTICRFSAKKQAR